MVEMRTLEAGQSRMQAARRREGRKERARVAMMMNSLVTRPVVRVGLKPFSELVVLGDEVAGGRVQTQAQQRACATQIKPSASAADGELNASIGSTSDKAELLMERGSKSDSTVGPEAPASRSAIEFELNGSPMMR
jgi:hypothetical protein